MILSAKGESFKYKGKSYTIGEQIIANNKSAYDGLIGIITEIRDGKDKETGNSAPDIYCSFTPPIFPDDIAALERKFSMLYKQPNELKEIVLLHKLRLYNCKKERTFVDEVHWEKWDTSYLCVHILFFLVVVVWGR